MPGVIELAKFRKKPEKKDRLAYYCQNCNSEQFRLSASGTVVCAACEYRMRNLAVTFLQKEPA